MKYLFQPKSNNNNGKLQAYSLLIFALLLAIMIITPALMSAKFPVYPLMKYGDVFDLLTPLVLIPMYGLLVKVVNPRPLNQLETVLFVLFSVLWVEGHSIHLAANSIGHLLSDSSDQEIVKLTSFYDELLSHYIWHLGIMGLSILLIYRQWNYYLNNQVTQCKLVVVGGLVYGLTYFIDVIESATAIIGIPNTLIMSIIILAKASKKLKYQPGLLFFLSAYCLANLLFLGWSLYWGGLPEFSEIGII